MAEFFTIAMLNTPAGVVLATTMVTQFIKDLPYLKDVPTRFVSFAVAMIITVLCTVTLGQLSVMGIVLCFLNSVVASLAANGAYDGFLKK